MKNPMERPPEASNEEEASFNKRHEAWKKEKMGEVHRIMLWSGVTGAHIVLAAHSEDPKWFAIAAAGSAIAAFTQYLSFRFREGSDQETGEEE